MITAVRRLRASKIEYMQSTWDEGHRVGREWAAKRASYDELLRISESEEYVATDCEGALGTMLAILNPDRRLSNEETIENAFGAEYLDARADEVFVGGFLAGASEFFEKVRDDL